MQKDVRKSIAQLSRRRPKPPSPKNERDCFILCEECGQAVDKRSAVQAFHHGEPEHAPLSEAELTELSLAETRWLRPSAKRGSAERGAAPKLAMAARPKIPKRKRRPEAAASKS